MIHVECPDCSKTYDVADELAGKAAKCRDCGGRIPIPQLRADTTSERTKPAQPKQAPTKSPSPKATTPPPAKPKPTAKPKPAPKKREDDFFEDDFEEVAEFDDVEEEVEEEWNTPKRSPSRRKKKSRGAAMQYGRFGGFVASGTGKLAWRIWLIGMFVVGLFGFLFFAFFAIGFFMRPNLIGGVIGAVMFGMLWLGFKGVRGKGIPVGPDYTMEGFSAELIGSLLVLVSNPFGWFVVLMLVGYVRMQGGMLVVGPQNNAPVVQPNVENAPTQASNQQSAAVANAVAGTAGESFQIANIPVPGFQELSALRPMAAGVTTVMCGQSATRPGRQPGSQMQFAYFEPVGTHPSKSLPCVIMASGGTVLMNGIDAPSPNSNPDVAQYTAAGFAVLGISIDGKIPNLPKPTLEEIRLAFSQFREAQAGLVNVRNGVEFLIQKVPQVDPNRLFVAGHSSAGTLALLAAAYEPRLKGCVAYCPASDGTNLMRGFLNDPRAEIAYPGITRFAKQVSPTTHVARMSCPIFLFHAADDPIIDVKDSRRLRQLLETHGKRNTYVEVPTGAHDIAVVKQGIPSALLWLRQLAGMSGASNAPTAQVASSNPAVLNGAELPAFPNFGSPNGGVPAGGLQPTGRAVTFRFQSFSGQGDSGAAARQALRNFTWADPNDIVIDPTAGEIRIGQLGGSLSTEPARQALVAAGFQMLPGVSVGPKKTTPSTTSEPTRPANSEPAAPISSTPAENPFTTKTPPAKVASKSTAPAVAEPAAPKESGPPRRVVTFRYERYTGKGSSTNAAVAALKRIKWADPDDIEVDAAKHEIRVGQIEESKEYGPAEKGLKDAGFSVTPGVTSGLRKR